MIWSFVFPVAFLALVVQGLFIGSERRHVGGKKREKGMRGSAGK